MTITLSAIHLYPVKSLGGISVTQAQCTRRGLAFDRRFMVVDQQGEFITQRDLPKMATVWVDIEDAALTLAAPDLDTVIVPLQPLATATFRVAVWSSEGSAQEVSADANSFLSAYLGVSCRLVYMPDSSRRSVNPEHAGNDEIVSFADGYPYLLTSEASLADLNSRLLKPVPMNRFRPNLVIKGGAPFAEDTWREIRIGESSFRLVKPCTRCQVTTTDQASGDMMGPEPLQTLATYRNGPEGVMFGQNLVAVKLGSVATGAVVEIIA
jgi:uncharacterized protein